MLTVSNTFHTNQYDTFVEQHPQRVLYHQREWWKLLEASYGYKPAPLVAQTEGNIVGVLPLMRVHGRIKGKRLVSLPFSHCVPILSSHPEADAALLNAAIQLAQDENYAFVEIRSSHPPESSAFQSSALNQVATLDLGHDEEVLFQALSSSHRRNVRTAEKAAFTFVEGSAEDFYQLEVSTRHRQGAPMYPPDFFKRLKQAFPKTTQFYLLKLEQRPIAGIILFWVGQTAVYGYGGSAIEEPEISKLKPNHLLMWEAIKASKRAGFKVFDFGTTPIHLTGLIEFKRRFGADVRDLPYYYYLNTRQELPVIKRDSRSVQLIENVLRRMPRYAFRHLSPWLLREVG